MRRRGRPDAAEIIDLCTPPPPDDSPPQPRPKRRAVIDDDDDDDATAGSIAMALAPQPQPQPQARNSSTANGASSSSVDAARPILAKQASSMSQATSDEVEACFSEDDSEDEVAAAAVPPDGFDLSGVVIADAGVTTCPLCEGALEPCWDATRDMIVVHDAVMLRHVVYHKRCAMASSFRLHAERRAAEAQAAAARRPPHDPRLPLRLPPSDPRVLSMR
jgi:hypothetical protein